MVTAKIFENGGSQAVRLPKEFRFSEREVAVNKVGSVVMLTAITDPWTGLLSSLEMFSDDFMADGRSDDQMQEREVL